MKCDYWLRRVDGFCAHLNAGLTAVAVMLCTLVAIQLTMRAETAFEGAYQQLATQGAYVLIGLMTQVSP